MNAGMYQRDRNPQGLYIENGKIKPDAPPAQLYDLETDPNQTVNLYDQHPDVVKQLASLLASYPAPRNSGSGKGKPAPAKNKRSSRKPATKSEATPTERSASFDFESGKLEITNRFKEQACGPQGYSDQHASVPGFHLAHANLNR